MQWGQNKHNKNHSDYNIPNEISPLAGRGGRPPAASLMEKCHLPHRPAGAPHPPRAQPRRPHRPDPVTVAAGELQGAELLIDMQAKKNYWLGTYEPELQAAVRHWLRPGMVVYDVGANIGYVSLLLARVSAGPAGPGLTPSSRCPPTSSAWRPTSSSTRGRHITCVPAAVVDHAGPVRFLAHASGAMGKAAGSAGRQHETYLAEIEVAGVTLDEFAYGPDVVGAASPTARTPSAPTASADPRLSRWISRAAKCWRCAAWGGCFPRPARCCSSSCTAPNRPAPPGTRSPPPATASCACSPATPQSPRSKRWTGRRTSLPNLSN